MVGDNIDQQLRSLTWTGIGFRSAIVIHNYRIGGRWSGFFLLKNGRKSSEARKGDIDFQGMMDVAEQKARKVFQAWKEATDPHPPILPWATVRAMHPDIEDARKFFGDQPGVAAARHIDPLGWRMDELIGKTLDQYVTEAREQSIRTFAVVIDGKWHEHGTMGWFACVSNENANWGQDYLKLLESIPDDSVLTVVDCHI